ncbi:MAG TPA: hypothetical protein PKC18_06400, partial [Lacipirellulaceae bacterium]|nr:hypothetical protein [Lacipirellulaceae bacterium]
MPPHWIAVSLARIPGVGAWLVVWTALLLATGVLVALMRTRWRHAKPWQKCAVLSLWVHVLLACLATNVRIGAGGAGGGGGGPVQGTILAVDVSALATPEPTTPAQP